MHVVGSALLYDKLPDACRLYHRSPLEGLCRLELELELELNLGTLGQQPLTFSAQSGDDR